MKSKNATSIIWQFIKYNPSKFRFNKRLSKQTISIAAVFDNSYSIANDEQFIASTVSGYAQRSPLEFVAEVYASMLNGEKFGADVMNLYNKYKGPVLPA